MQSKFKFALGAAAMVLASQAMAQITFYEGEDFRGRALTTDRRIGDMERQGFSDRASSIVIDRGRWEVCEDIRFEGRCMVLRRGSYPSLREMGMANTISSVRPADDGRRYSNEAPVPAPSPVYEYRRRANERVYEAPVTSVRAVVGPPNQRCWVERQAVQQPGQPNVGGAVAGALIGGILGHQIGKGSGRDAATAGGVVAGAAIGANSGGGSSGGTSYNDVQRCQNVASTTPAYWDVTYNYRGMEHRIQMSAPPGPTVAVNANGEPRQ
ncbi:MAG: beta/gamma crystallin-related protein [Ramlibacter sp.]